MEAMKRIFLTLIFAAGIVCAEAQSKHAQVYLGGGYGLISGDMYFPGCWEVNLGLKYFVTDGVFLDLNAQIGGNKGIKKQTISKGFYSELSDFEHTLSEYGLFFGPGYNLYNNGQSRLYVKAQAGYTWGHEYKEILDEQHNIRAFPEQPYKPGFAASAGIGYDWQKAGNPIAYGGKIDVYYIRGHVMAIINAQIGVFF